MGLAGAAALVSLGRPRVSKRQEASRSETAFPRSCHSCQPEYPTTPCRLGRRSQTTSSKRADMETVSEPSDRGLPAGHGPGSSPGHELGVAVAGASAGKGRGAQVDGRLALVARVLVAAAGLGGLAALRPRPVGLTGAAALLVYVVLGALATRSPVSGWPARILHPVDVVAAGLSAAVVAGVAVPTVAPLGVVAAVPLVLVSAFAEGRAAGLRIGVIAVGSGALASLAAGHPLAAGVIAADLPVVAWVTWVGLQGGALVVAASQQRTDLARARSEMVTTVSHELRTPLTVIQGAMATLSRRWDVLTEPERLDLIDVMIDNVASLDSSILHFVDASRLERGEYQICPEWVAVGEVVTSVTAKLSTVLSGREIQTELVLQQVWADRDALRRIIEHLLVNAVRFSAMGLPIRVRCVSQDSDAVISVTDRGHGIAPHLVAKVWEPLERGDVSETGVSRGAGLGLPIVRELAELHGGSADLSSVRGRGTTVTVRLPQPAGMPALDELTELPRTRRRWRGQRSGEGRGERSGEGRGQRSGGRRG